MIVSDSHDNVRNLLPDELHEDVLLVRGSRFKMDANMPHLARHPGSGLCLVSVVIYVTLCVERRCKWKVFDIFADPLEWVKPTV